MRTAHDLTPVRIPIVDLIHHPDNARVHDMETLKTSLTTHGQFNPVVRQLSTGYVIKGNGTMAAAAELGWTDLDVVTLDVDDDQAVRILLIDNKSSDSGRYDEQPLAALLASLGDDFTGSGYTVDDLGDLLSVLNPPSLDDLERQHGHDFSPEALWPVLRFRVAPLVRDRYLKLVEGVSGGEDVLFAHLVDLAEKAR